MTKGYFSHRIDVCEGRRIIGPKDHDGANALKEALG